MGNLNISDPVLKNKISEITTIGKKYALNEGIPPQELKIDWDFDKTQIFFSKKIFFAYRKSPQKGTVTKESHETFSVDFPAKAS